MTEALMIQVANPASVSRTQYVRIGVPYRDPQALLHLPDSSVIARKITVQPYYFGTMDVAKHEAYVPRWHPVVSQLGVIVDGHRLAPTYNTTDGSIHFIYEDGDGEFRVDLNLFGFANEPWFYFDLRVVSHEHSTYFHQPTIEFKITNRDWVVVDRVYGTFVNKHDIKPEHRAIWAGQGYRSYGVLLPVPTEEDNFTPTELLTMAALLQADLSVTPSQQKEWGAFGADPQLVPPDEAFLGTRIREVQQPAYSRAGEILFKQPQTTGWQPFGVWHGVEGVFDPRYHQLDRLSVMRESLRSHHWFDGLQILQRANHPDLVLWNGEPHFDLNVSPDQLDTEGQLSGRGPSDWYSYGSEHADCGCLAVDVIRHGSYLSQEELLHVENAFILSHTLPSEKPGWSTTGRHTGRARGRWYLAAVEIWRGTGSTAAVEHAAKRFLESELPYLFRDDQGALPGPVFADTLIGPHPNYLPDRPSWRCWEDGILCYGWRALERALRHSALSHFQHMGRSAEQVADLILDAIRKVATSLALYGFDQQSHRVLWCLEWKDRGADPNGQRFVADEGITAWALASQRILMEILGPDDDALPLSHWEHWSEAFAEKPDRRLMLGAR